MIKLKNDNWIDKKSALRVGIALGRFSIGRSIHSLN